MPKDDQRTQYTDEDYRFIASRHLDRLTQDRVATRRSLADQTRWLVLQLFIVNVGGLAALLVADRLQGSLSRAGAWFLTGLILSILCAFAAWVQTRITVSRLSAMANPEMVTDRRKWPKDLPLQITAGNIAFMLAAAAALGSLLAFIIGIYQIDVEARPSPIQSATSILSDG